MVTTRRGAGEDVAGVVGSGNQAGGRGRGRGRGRGSVRGQPVGSGVDTVTGGAEFVAAGQVQQEVHPQVNAVTEPDYNTPLYVTVVGDIPRIYVPPAATVYPPRPAAQQFYSRPPASAFYPPPPPELTPQPTVIPPPPTRNETFVAPGYAFDQQDSQQQQYQRYHPYRAAYPGIPPQQNQYFGGNQGPAEWYTKMKRIKIDDFFGNVAPAAAEVWIRGFEKACKTLHIPVSEWAQLAVSLLSGNAQNWMEAIEQVSGSITDWTTFRDLFYKEYFPRTVQTAKASEFLHLRQGQHLSVTQFSHKFHELGRFYPEIMCNEERKLEHFMEGLSREIVQGLGGVRPTSMAELMDRALNVERILAKPSFVVGNKRPFGSYQGSNRGAPQQNLKRTAAPAAVQTSGASAACSKCNRVHSGECRAVGSGCYHCGEVGHFSRACPKKFPQGNPAVSRSNQNGNRGASSRPTRVFAIDAEPEEPDDFVVTDEQVFDGENDEEI